MPEIGRRFIGSDAPGQNWSKSTIESTAMFEKSVALTPTVYQLTDFQCYFA